MLKKKSEPKEYSCQYFGQTFTQKNSLTNNEKAIKKRKDIGDAKKELELEKETKNANPEQVEVMGQNITEEDQKSKLIEQEQDGINQKLIENREKSADVKSLQLDSQLKKLMGTGGAISLQDAMAYAVIMKANAPQPQPQNSSNDVLLKYLLENMNKNKNDPDIKGELKKSIDLATDMGLEKKVSDATPFWLNPLMEN